MGSHPSRGDALVLLYFAAFNHHAGVRDDMTRPGFAHRLLHVLERISLASGHGISWLALAMVLLMVAVVVLRYGFDYGNIALQEAVLYMHGALFMIGAAYTLACDEHVRVDIFYRRLGPRGQARVNLVGTLLFLMPLAVLFLWLSWDYVWASWIHREGSLDAGGLPFLYLLKTLLLIMPLLLFIQGLAELLRAWLTLRDPTSPPPRHNEQEGRGWN